MPQVFISYQLRDHELVEKLAGALGSVGLGVWLDTDKVQIGDSFQDTIELRMDTSDAMVVLVTGEELSPWTLREIEAAEFSGMLLIPVLTTDASRRRLPHSLASRVSATVDFSSPESLRRVAEEVRHAIGARQERVRYRAAPDVRDGAFSHDELADVRDMVVEAFAAAHRPLRPDPDTSTLLHPGPVWISTEVAPTGGELDRFAEHIPHGGLGYFVHVGELSREAQIALDQMRVGGKPAVAITVRSLRAALADQRVGAFLGELERDYGNRDNLFDTRNALIDERFLYGRDVLLNTIGSALRRNEHVLVTGLRKVGKTSLLNILRQHLVDRPVCQVDLQRFDRHREDWPRELFSLVLRAFDRWGRVERGDWPFEPARPGTATELEDELDRRQRHLDSPTTVVVVLDELERVFPAPGEDHAARQWVLAAGALRALAQGEHRHLVVIAADLRAEVNRANDLGPAGTNPFFSFFQETPVPMLDGDAVDEMVLSLAGAMGVDVVGTDFVGELFELTGGHPSLVRTLAGEAYRQRRRPYELAVEGLRAGLDRLEDTDAVGFFLRNNLWQLMTPVEREVVLAVVHDRPVPEFVPRAAERQARAALRAQGLVDGDGVRIGLFRQWLLDGEAG
ncbi:toll/interleukin-1 receptor domain-containing protein [Actinosynnema sp. NPDC050801]|uniref:toll/interleukin-1 receptor domain-containing protein n=1 Tax=unclassified Actinosynnema TaxID=2637065 RepID=UPI0033D60DA2